MPSDIFGFTKSIVSAADFGVRCDNNQDNSLPLNAAIFYASQLGYAWVLLPGTDSEYDQATLWIGATIQMRNNVGLIGPRGLVVKVLPSLTGNAIGNVDQTNGNSGLAIVGGFTIDGNRANATGSFDLINLEHCDDVALDVIVQNAYRDGVALVSCNRPKLDVVATANGQHGVHLTTVTFARGTIASYNNGARVAGHGIALETDATDNTCQVACTDTRSAGSKTQEYGILEGADTGCDRNVFVGSCTGNATGATSFSGASSFLLNNPTFTSPTITGTPATAAGQLGWNSTDKRVTFGDGTNSHEIPPSDSPTLTNPTVSGHLKPAGTVPTVAAQSGLGTSPPAPTIDANATDAAGRVLFGTGTTPTTGPLVQVTYNAPYVDAPFVALTPTDITTSPLELYVVSTVGYFTICCAVAPAGGQLAGNFSCSYHVIGK